MRDQRVTDRLAANSEWLGREPKRLTYEPMMRIRRSSGAYEQKNEGKRRQGRCRNAGVQPAPGMANRQQCRSDRQQEEHCFIARQRPNVSGDSQHRVQWMTVSWNRRLLDQPCAVAREPMESDRTRGRPGCEFDFQSLARCEPIPVPIPIPMPIPHSCLLAVVVITIIPIATALGALHSIPCLL